MLADRSDQVYVVMGLDPPQMLYVSPAFERIWKMPVSTVMGDPQIWIGTILAEDRTRVLDLFAELFSNRLDRYDINYRIIDGEHTVRWIRDTGTVIRDESGSGRLVIGIVEDSTELHRSAHSLKRRIEWYQLITEQVPVSMWTTDRDLRFTSSAGLGLTALGLKPDQLVGVTLYEFLQTDDREQQAIKEHLRALEGAEPEYDYVLEMGDVTRVYHTKLCPFRDPRGDTVGVIGIAFDVTELKNAEAAILESEKTFRNLIEFNPDFVAIAVDDKVQYLNKSFLQETGYTAEELLGKSPLVVMAPEDRDRTAERLRELIAGAEPRPSEYSLLRKDGSALAVEIIGQRITFQGKPALFGLMRDISRHKERESAFRQHGEELERLINERTSQIQELERQRSESEKLAATGRMAARVAHEINNPLASIKSAYRLIRGAVPDSHPHYQFVSLIDREIDRIANIVKLMHRLYRPGPIQREWVDLEYCIRDVVTLISLTAEGRGVRIEVGEIGCPRLRLPVGHIEQILFNLVQNALEASSEGGEVEVSATCSLEGIEVRVSDRGSGVPVELQEQIFEPFYSTKTSGEQPGLGLGLSVTRSLVEALGGSIEYSDRPGGGAVFTVALPSDSG